MFKRAKANPLSEFANSVCRAPAIGQDKISLSLRVNALSREFAYDPVRTDSERARQGRSENTNLLLLKLGCALFSERTPPTPDDFRPDAETVLLAIAEWWQAERETLIPAYERSVYPTEGFAFASLTDDSDETWFTLLALATFQTLGRIKPDQSRHFVTHAIHEGWWHQLSTINPDADNLDPFVERLRAWSEPDAREDYMIWRRCLTDLCLIARHLDDYRSLFRRLPGIIRQDGPVSIGNLLRPAFSVAASRITVCLIQTVEQRRCLQFSLWRQPISGLC